MRLLRFRHKAPAAPHPLRIQGIPEAPMTPKPDDAELAAQALLEHMCDVRGKREDVEGKHQPSEPRDAAYYKQLAARIQDTRLIEKHLTMRFLAYCEQQLAIPVVKTAESMLLNNLEEGLFERQDIAYREGGELKRRWQHCLADITVRRMNLSSEPTDTADGKLL